MVQGDSNSLKKIAVEGILRRDRKLISKSTSYSIKNKKKSGLALKHSAGFIKKIARMPLKDRKKILKVLKKQDCKRRVLSKASKGVTASLSNSSTSSVNKDWGNWVILHSKKEAKAEDVREIGKTLGVKFKGDNNNSFNLLSREGRRELRAVRGSSVEEGSREDGGAGGEGI